MIVVSCFPLQPKSPVKGLDIAADDRQPFLDRASLASVLRIVGPKLNDAVCDLP